MSVSTDDIEKVIDQFTKPMEFFKEPALSDEIDLVSRVRELFIKHGALEEDMAKTFDQSHFVQDAKNKHAPAQQFLLNQFCADEYFKKEEEGLDTRMQRHVLIYNIQSDHWLTIMDQTVIPNMLELGLPAN